MLLSYKAPHKNMLFFFLSGNTIYFYYFVQKQSHNEITFQPFYLFLKLILSSNILFNYKKTKGQTLI